MSSDQRIGHHGAQEKHIHSHFVVIVQVAQLVWQFSQAVAKIEAPWI